jgi:hypothetical protein
LPFQDDLFVLIDSAYKDKAGLLSTSAGMIGENPDLVNPLLLVLTVKREYQQTSLCESYFDKKCRYWEAKVSTAEF